MRPTYIEVFRENKLVENRIIDKNTPKHKGHNIVHDVYVYKRKDFFINKKKIAHREMMPDYIHIWEGDIDFELDETRLQNVVRRIKSPLYLITSDGKLHSIVYNNNIKFSDN